MLDKNYQRKDFELDEIYENIYDEDEYEAVLVYRREMNDRNKKEITKEELKDYQS